MSTIKIYVERCVSAHGRDCDMLDMITVIIGVVGALLGIAGSLLVVGGTLLLVALIKNFLPVSEPSFPRLRLRWLQ